MRAASKQATDWRFTSPAFVRCLCFLCIGFAALSADLAVATEFRLVTTDYREPQESSTQPKQVSLARKADESGKDPLASFSPLSRAMLVTASDDLDWGKALKAIDSIAPNENGSSDETIDDLIEKLKNIAASSQAEKRIEINAKGLFRLYDLVGELKRLGVVELATDGYSILVAGSTEADRSGFAMDVACELVELYVENGDHSSAESLLECLKEAESHDKPTLQHAQAMLHYSKGSLAEAEGILLPLVEVETDELFLADAYVLLARLALDQGEIQNTQNHLASLRNIANKKPIVAEKASLVSADLKLAQDNSLDALIQYHQLAESAKSFIVRREALEKLVDYYALNEQFAKAFKYDQHLDQLEETHLDLNSRIVAQMGSGALNAYSDVQDARLQKAQIEKTKVVLQNRNFDLEQTLIISYVSIGVSLILAFGVVTFHWLDNRYRRERAELKFEKQNSHKLEALVKEKTNELQSEHDERLELEKTLERRRRDESIGQLTGNVAHDFNNLLQVVISTNEFLKGSRGRLTEEEVDLLEISTKSAQIGTSIVKQLLAYARQQNLTPSVMSVADYIDGTCSLLNAAVGRSCKLEVNDLSARAKLLLDPVQLTTALINLLTNSVDAMPDGGVIKLVARKFDRSTDGFELWNDLNQTSEYIAFDVIDQGSGLTEAEKQRVFEPFYTTKTSTAGTGLGLSSVHGFVKQSGGEVQLFDHQPKGLRVTMVFPVTKVSLPQPSYQPSGEHQAKGRVLVVEDNLLVGQSIVKELRGLGFEPALVDTGASAKDRILDGEIFDLILSDVRMPGEIGGIELREWVEENMPEMAIILMSGYTDIDISPNETAFLQKPFSTLELTQKINEVFSSQRNEKSMTALDN